MDKKKFDKIMEEWAAHYMGAAPDLEPSPEVYQKLEEKKKKPRFVLFSWPVRLAAAGIAAAFIILLVVIQPPKKVEPFLGLRKGIVAEKVQVLDEAEAEEQAEEVIEPEKAKRVEKEKEGKKEEKSVKIEHDLPPAKTMVVEKMEKPKIADKEILAQPKEVAARPRMEVKPEKKDVRLEVKRSQMVPELIEFQYQPKGSEAIERLDISAPQDEIMSLSSEDNYRLILQLPLERYVYVFQVGADEQLIRLFPNREYNPVQNPLQAGKTIIIPLPPNWFYVEKGTGEVLIYVVTSAEPLQDWDEIYAKIASGLLDQMEQDKRKPEDQVSVRVFKFNVHGSL